MNQEKKSEALSMAHDLESFFISEEVNATKAKKIATELRRLHAENSEQRAKLVAEAARTAEEKLRADQMTKQHRTQCDISKSAVATLVGLGYTDRGGEQWAPPIGKAPDFNLLDAAHARIADLEAQLSAIGAGGVESLRKREQAVPTDERQRMTAGRASFFMERFLKEEKLLGPNEQAALHFVIDMLAAPAQTQDDLAAFKAYLQECDDCAIVPDVAGAFNAGWTAAARDPAQEHATQLAGQGQWTDLGYTSAAHYAEDMQAVGEALMEAVKDNYASLQAAGWRPSDSPAEIVVDLLNLLDQANAAAPAQAHKDEQA